eukprot:SAG22_NODE_71_length_22540_cov_8.918052_10_plen_326_part_00
MTRRRRRAQGPGREARAAAGGGGEGGGGGGGGSRGGGGGKGKGKGGQRQQGGGGKGGKPGGKGGKQQHHQPAAQLTGQIKLFDTEKGFGFITPDSPVDGLAAGRDLYVHRQELGAGCDTPGTAVTFGLKDHKGVTQAARLRPAGPGAAPAAGGGGKGGRPSVYAEYLPEAEVAAGLAAGTLLSGSVRLMGAVGFVAVAGIGKDVLLEGLEAQNRCFEGDVVAVRMLPVGEWKDDAKELPTAAAAAPAPSDGPASASEPEPAPEPEPGAPAFVKKVAEYASYSESAARAAAPAAASSPAEAAVAGLAEQVRGSGLRPLATVVAIVR